MDENLDQVRTGSGQVTHKKREEEMRKLGPGLDRSRSGHPQIEEGRDGEELGPNKIMSGHPQQ